MRQSGGLLRRRTRQIRDAGSRPEWGGPILYRRRLSYANVRAFLSSVMPRGLVGKARLSYRKSLLTAAARYRHSFGTAMTLAVMGHHFHVMLEQLSKADT